jgi:LysR family transcriptional regulator of beta-lactamase
MFGEALRTERLMQPFALGVSLGRYWLARLKSRPVTQAMRTFREWLLAEAAG